MDHHFLQFFFNENRGFSSKLNINFMELTSFRLWAASPVAYVLLFRWPIQNVQNKFFFLANITITYFFQILLR